MKKILILLLILSNTFATEISEYGNQSPSRWKSAANFLGFGLSTEFQVPPATTSRITYGLSSIGLGVAEILASQQLTTQHHIDSQIPSILGTILLPHAFSNIFSGASILGNLIWDMASDYMGVPVQKSNTIKSSISNKIRGGTQIITGLFWMRLPHPYLLLPGLAFTCRGFYNLWHTDPRLNQNCSPWDRICNGVTRFSAALVLMDFYLKDIFPSFFLPTKEIHAIPTGAVIYDPYNPYYIFKYDNSSKVICKHIADPATFSLAACCPGEEIIEKFFKNLEINPQSYSKMLLRNVCRADRHDWWWTVDELLGFSGVAELAGGIKDTLFIFKMMLAASLKATDDEDHDAKIAVKIKKSQLKEQTSNQREKQPSPPGQRKNLQSTVNQQSAYPTQERVEEDNDRRSVAASSETFLQEPSKRKQDKNKEVKQKWKQPAQKKHGKKSLESKESVRVQAEEYAQNPLQIQEEPPEFLPPGFVEKPKSLNWRKARTKLKQYGIIINKEAGGSGIKLTFRDKIRTLHIHKKAGAEVRGGRMKDILYMLWVASQVQLEDGSVI